MHRKALSVRNAGILLCLIAIAVTSAAASNGSGTIVGPDGQPISGAKFNILSAGTNKTPTVTPPTDDHGQTRYDTTAIAPGIYNIWWCPDGKTVYAVPNDQAKNPPCPDAVYVGTVPITPNAPFLAVSVGDSPNNSTVTSWINGVNPVTGTTNDSVVYVSGHESYSIRPDDNNPQTYTVTQTTKNGTTYVKTGVPASQVGTIPFEELHGDGTLYVYTSQPDADQPATTENPQTSGQGIGASPSGQKTGSGVRVAEPAQWANTRFKQNLARLYDPNAPSGPLGLLAMINPDPFALFHKESPSATQRISYMLVANGNSSGEVFSLLVSDPSSRVEEVPIDTGTALEPTGRKLAQPPPPGTSKRHVNGYCLDFHKEPPAPGSLYQIAGPEKQEGYAHIRYILAAVETLKAQGKLHPDTDAGEYLDAIRQYSVWSKEENWNQQQFTENWIERTRKNAAFMKVKWTNQMEKTLRQAAPGRWSDITQVLQMAGRAERNREAVLALAKQGGPWKQ
ncbi:MAG TPA: hypothetical protein VMG82_17685 [Candidatus Sulfotelmatobacter sp.]|nr:hypothetical protein [Candidatus Sulfotelmatobacter sp.]